jgi:uncharacterized protein
MFSCPKCHASMHTLNRNGIQIEQCSECRGIFLDAGELEALGRIEQQFYPPPGSPPPGYGAPPPGYGGPPPGYGPPHGGPPAWGGHHYGHHGYKKKKYKGFAHMLFSS